MRRVVGKGWAVRLDGAAWVGRYSSRVSRQQRRVWESRDDASAAAASDWHGATVVRVTYYAKEER
jgi:hypothetical protein